MSLILMPTDAESTLVRRRGRFSVERDCVKDQRHFWAAVQDAQEKMIAGLAARGYEWVGPDWELSDPMPHVEFAQSTEADPGPAAMPDPRDVSAMQSWERAEKARMARKLGDASGLVDFFVVSTFRVRRPQYLRVVGGSPVWPTQ